MNPFNKSHKQLSIFITAGYPTKTSLINQLELLEKSNVDFVEIGIPFSDPLADGETIQKSSSIALKNEMTIDLIFDQISQAEFNKPIAIMGYFNPILKYGFVPFLKRCKENRVSALIVPDLSIEIYERDYEKYFDEFEISPVFLITNRTKDERIIRMSKKSENSFIYLVPQNATTGVANELSIDQSEIIRIKNLVGNTPMMIGFGINDKNDLGKAQLNSNGGIIGSAFIRAIENDQVNLFLEKLTN